MGFRHTFGVRVDGLRPEGCGRLTAAGCVRFRSGGDSACGAEGGGGGFAADY